MHLSMKTHQLVQRTTELYLHNSIDSRLKLQKNKEVRQRRSHQLWKKKS
ncbi:Uncharacterized protein APZ42_022715 [Daphnia magna]|uniref:Uncharacterized protein n=1 Tax=Daphnia magna TaxID=35525 RepID=A0A164VQE1_9CRUS|nr:Uncharacterized protein APZ42_022715 [Daphnia magna]